MQLTINPKHGWGISADSVLNKAIISWVSVALVGQWTFVLYILSLCIIPFLIGTIYQDEQTSSARTAFISEVLNYIILFSHALIATIMAVSSLLQMLPKMRKTYPKFYCWNNRTFFTFGLSGAATGLYLTWVADIHLNFIDSLGVKLNGVLILVGVYFACKIAIEKQFTLHQRWAVHASIVINGLWTFNLFLMGWYLVNPEPTRNNSNFDEQVDLTLSFVCYLFPLFLAELMLFTELLFWAKRKKTNQVKWLVVFATSVAIVITLTGLSAAIMLI